MTERRAGSWSRALPIVCAILFAAASVSACVSGGPATSRAPSAAPSEVASVPIGSPQATTPPAGANTSYLNALFRSWLPKEIAGAPTELAPVRELDPILDVQAGALELDQQQRVGSLLAVACADLHVSWSTATTQDWKLELFAVTGCDAPAMRGALIAYVVADGHPVPAAMDVAGRAVDVDRGLPGCGCTEGTYAYAVDGRLWILTGPLGSDRLDAGTAERQAKAILAGLPG